MPKKVFEDIRAITQRQLKTDYISRAGRLDLLCTTKSGEQFNIELQMTNEHNLPQWARYYHALLANHMLVVGEDYPNLKDSYVIFLCNFDHNGYGHAVTHYQAFSSRSLADSLGNGSHTIVLNAKGNWDEVNDELKGIFASTTYSRPFRSRDSK